MTVKVKITGKLPENPIIIEAFPSRGYVSTLSTNHMIKQLNMDVVGHLECDKLDAIAVVHDSLPIHPIRIYAKDDIVIIFSELIIPFNLTHEFTTALGDWFSEVKPKSTIFLASIPGVDSDKEHEIMGVSTDEAIKKKLMELDVKMMEEGVLTGISSSLILKCMTYDIPATSLMVETTYIPDVLAASALLKILKHLLDVDVDVDQLVKAGETIESKFKTNMDQMKKGHEKYNLMHEQSTMYR